ncbi:MAG: hypothetical protein WAT19_01375 [Ferruginibacter sp.]
MKQLFRLFAVIITAAIASSCTKDFVSEHYTFYRPVYKTTDEVKAGIKSGAAATVTSPGKIFVKGSFAFLNEIDKGVHIIDFSNPAAPVNKAFVEIPGCRDIAVRGNYLYADCYTDLVTIDITNPQNVTLKSFINGVFPWRYYNSGIAYDNGKIIVDWIKVDTVIRHQPGGNLPWWNNMPILFFSPTDFNGGIAAANNGGITNGTGGSMAAFALLGNRMYTVDYQNLKVFNTSNAALPAYVKNIALPGWNIETIYPFNDKLFIGSQSGMMIYDASVPDDPTPLGALEHVRTCDPVIADGNYAYVTLRSGTECQGFTNQLDVLDISNLLHPVLVKTYLLTNPHGLAKDGNTLLICDGDGGLKVFNAADVNNIQQSSIISNMETYDVIAINGTAVVSAKDGIYFIDYSNPANANVKGKINVIQ